MRLPITQHKSATATSNTARLRCDFAELAHQDVDITTAKSACGPVMFNRDQSLPSALPWGKGHVSTLLHFGWQLRHQAIHSSWNCSRSPINGTELRLRPQSTTSLGRDRKGSRPTCWITARSVNKTMDGNRDSPLRDCCSRAPNSS